MPYRRLLEGKTAFITAGTSGLGKAFSRAFALHGAAVGIHYRSDEAGARELVREIRDAGGRADAVRADLRDPDETKGMVDHLRQTLGQPDVLMNNASIFRESRTVDVLPWQDVQDEFEGSLKTAFFTTQAVLPDMLERQGGTLLFMVGTILQSPIPGYAAHAAGKGALLAWARTLAREVAPRGVSVHFISPGTALTPNVLATFPKDDLEEMRQRTPSRHLPTPEELARVAVFLASDLAVSATGLHINADGGRADLT